MAKSIVIVGGGIAGLSCGCYAAMNGYRATVLEMHSLPGGVCTAWRRKGYTFDGCIHWLLGSNPTSRTNVLWRELGVASRHYLDPEMYRQYVEEGCSVCLYSDPARLEAHLLEIAPEDEALIRELVSALKRISPIEMPIDSPLTWRGLKLYASLLPVLPVFRKFSRMPLTDLLARMKSPLLRRAFETMFPVLDAPVTGVLMGLAVQARQNGGYPVGGSLSFAQAMARRLTDLGGEIVYRAKVKEILVEDGRAVGARTEDGREFRADRVVSAADGRATLYRMLGGRFLTPALRALYEGEAPLFPPLVQVSLGLRRKIESGPTVAFRLAEPIQDGPKAHRDLVMRNLGEDPELAPPGCTTISVQLVSEFDHWAKLREDEVRYAQEKRRIADEVIARLDRQWPGLAASVEVVDVATPCTWERLTGNWRGAFEGWMLTTENMEKVLKEGLPKQLPGLRSFSMIGQWTTFGGGLPPVAKDARDLVRKFCREDGRTFATSEQPTATQEPTLEAA